MRFFLLILRSKQVINLADPGLAKMLQLLIAYIQRSSRAIAYCRQDEFLQPGLL